MLIARLFTMSSNDIFELFACCGEDFCWGWKWVCCGEFLVDIEVFFAMFEEIFVVVGIRRLSHILVYCGLIILPLVLCVSSKILSYMGSVIGITYIRLSYLDFWLNFFSILTLVIFMILVKYFIIFRNFFSQSFYNFVSYIF